MRKPRAFTLIETIFSTLFIGVTVLAIVNLFPGAYLSIRQGECQTQADILAASIIDDLRSLRLSRICDDLGAGGLYTNPDPLYQPTTIDGVVYTPVVTCEPIDASLGAGLFPAGMPDPRDVSRFTITVNYRVGSSLKRVTHETVLHRMSFLASPRGFAEPSSAVTP